MDIKELEEKIKFHPTPIKLKISAATRKAAYALKDIGGDKSPIKEILSHDEERKKELYRVCWLVCKEVVESEWSLEEMFDKVANDISIVKQAFDLLDRQGSRR